MPPWARLPGAPEPTGELFLEAFGELSLDRSLADVAAGEGALWGVFMDRANLMSWSATLWSMHEGELTAGRNASRIGYVQVGPQQGIEPALALPAMIQCFDDALRRFGDLELSGLQVTASHLQPSEGSCAGDLISGLYWFNVAPKERASALLAFDNELLGARAEAELVASLQQMNTGPFEFGPLVAVPDQHSIKVAVEAPLQVAPSPAQWAVPVTLPEWTASAVAWAMALVIDTARAAAPDVRDFIVRLSRVQRAPTEAEDREPTKPT